MQGSTRGDLTEAELVAYRAAARPSYAELEAILEQVRAYANLPTARTEDGFDRAFIAGDASCRRGLRAIPGVGA